MVEVVVNFFLGDGHTTSGDRVQRVSSEKVVGVLLVHFKPVSVVLADGDPLCSSAVFVDSFPQPRRIAAAKDAVLLVLEDGEVGTFGEVPALGSFVLVSGVGCVAHGVSLSLVETRRAPFVFALVAPHPLFGWHRDLVRFGCHHPYRGGS